MLEIKIFLRLSISPAFSYVLPYIALNKSNSNWKSSSSANCLRRDATLKYLPAYTPRPIQSKKIVKESRPKAIFTFSDRVS
jgi:hypothetical protein